MGNIQKDAAASGEQIPVKPAPAEFWGFWSGFQQQPCSRLDSLGAVAALMIIAFIVLVVAFIISFVALCCTLNISLLPFIGVIVQIIALIIYPVKFNELIYEGYYDYTWAYGFGWGATILMLGCGILFCCLPNYEDELSGMAKTTYIYSSA
ncbi:hypothetical protein DNTS_014058 [Danionella cerebrum]|uniref:P53 apoptosis effector related to PMP-22 n=1 Tax=Danionella cerebrum TaxID=2873325 RepID=A0A553NIH3_9TELE|nr:hypothetical protein DNTS_014058 [Danionella translucida]